MRRPNILKPHNHARGRLRKHVDRPRTARRRSQKGSREVRPIGSWVGLPEIRAHWPQGGQEVAMSLAVREEMRDCSRRVCDQSEQIHMAASLEPCPVPPPIEADDALLLPTGERRFFPAPPRPSRIVRHSGGIMPQALYRSRSLLSDRGAASGALMPACWPGLGYTCGHMVKAHELEQTLRARSAARRVKADARAARLCAHQEGQPL